MRSSGRRDLQPAAAAPEGSDACGGCEVIALECDEGYAERREQDRVD